MTIDEYAGDSVGFAKWLHKVNDKLEARYGLGVLDLPDQSYYSMYEDSYTTFEVIKAMWERGDIW